MTKVPNYVRFLALVLALVFCVSIIDDDLFLQSSATTGLGKSQLKNNTNTEWAQELASWSLNASSSWNSWIPLNSSLTDWAGWWGDNGDNDGEGGMNKSSKFPWLSTPFKPLVSIVIDFSADGDVSKQEQGHWMSRMAFAKMLQLEARKRHGVETELIVVGSIPWRSECFPNLQITAVPDPSELKLKELEQDSWLDEKAILLEASPDVWQDALHILRKHYRSKGARYASEISLPFLRVDRMAPVVSEWTNVPELIDFLKVDPSCCTLPATMTSEDIMRNTTVVNMERHSQLQPEHLGDLLKRTNATRIVLVGTTPENTNEYVSLLQNNLGYVAQSIPITSPGFSEAARFCLLQTTDCETIGSLDSPLSVWAAIANRAAQDVRLVGDDMDDVSKLQQVKYADPDPRSNVRIEYELLSSAKNSTKMEAIPQGGEDVMQQIGRSSDASNVTSIVIQLSGELGNQLCKFAFGYGLKWILEEDYHVTTNVILRHQEHRKWLTAWKSVKTCFPNLRDMDFSEGNTEEFEERLKQQQMWLGDGVFTLNGCQRETCIREQLDKLVGILSNATNPPPGIPVNANITLPFLYADTYGMLDYINDRFYDRFKGDLFQFDLDNPECCDPKAQLDETVFHARGYITEMPRVAMRMGFEEISPNKTVNELLQNHRPGDKVAVLSRFAPFGQRYVDQMVSAGLDARLVETRNGELSFCFLMSARKELIGCSQSTFAVWASYLGNASKSRIYSLRSPERIRATGDACFVRYNFTNPRLSQTFSFELYNSEAQDQIDGTRRQLLLQSSID